MFAPSESAAVELVSRWLESAEVPGELFAASNVVEGFYRTWGWHPVLIPLIENFGSVIPEFYSSLLKRQGRA